VLDEPTTGLHFSDIDVLVQALLALRDAGNTLIIIEHNLDVVACADWVVDMGPEGGERGGEVVASGTPQQVAANPHSKTAPYLLRVLQEAQGEEVPRKVGKNGKANTRNKDTTSVASRDRNRRGGRGS
jgi:excinuclease ABC subunit A